MAVGSSMISSMESRVKRPGPMALHEQTAAGFGRAIAKCVKDTGDRQSLAKDLAEIMTINKDSFIRPLRVLGNEGSSDLVPGHNITYTYRPEEIARWLW